MATRRRVDGSYWVIYTRFPKIADVAAELRSINKYDAGEDGIDVRLQVYPDGDWAVRWGSSDYDQDHRGYWGASSVPGSNRRFDSKDVARDLIDQAKQAHAMDDEGEELDEKTVREMKGYFPPPEDYGKPSGPVPRETRHHQRKLGFHAEARRWADVPYEELLSIAHAHKWSPERDAAQAELERRRIALHGRRIALLVTRIDADANLRSALMGSGESTSRTTDDSGVEWIWAGYLGRRTPGDGTRECEILRDMGLLGEDSPEDGYHVYPVTALGKSVIRALREVG